MDESTRLGSGQGQAPAPQHPHADGAATDAAQSVKDLTGALWGDAKEAARSKLNEQKDAAAEGIDDVAAALHDSASNKSGQDGQAGGHDTVARLADSVADALMHLSSSLRDKDVGTMLSDINHFTRTQPLAFFGLAVAAGFAAVRLSKTSQH